MELWSMRVAIFILAFALVIIPCALIVARMVVKSVDPNDAAQLIATDALYADRVSATDRDVMQARRFTASQDEDNEKRWSWRLNALERRVHELEEKARCVETRSFDVELRSLRLYVGHSADKTRIALQTANEALNVARRTDDAVQNVIDSATLRAAVAFHANAIMKDSTPEDDSEEERVAAIEVDCYCVHGNPVEFHYEGGCDV